MVNEQEIKSLLQEISKEHQIDVSQVTVQEFTITINANASSMVQAEAFKLQAENLLATKYPEHHIVVAINNQNIKVKRSLPGVTKIITVSSGKGGVGKSTISAAVAKLLAEQGNKVGIIDADIHGPSMPRILNIQDAQPEFRRGKILPATSCGIKVMSIGFLMEEKGALAWRGPMLAKAVMQLFLDVDWGELDYLIVDTPPGTGDIHITILSNYQIDGVFIVTIPSAVSLDSVIRSIDLYEKFNINIYGIIENMSYYYDQHSKQRIPLFGESLTGKLASEYALKMIDPINLIPGLSEVKFADITKHMKIDLHNVDL